MKRRPTYPEIQSQKTPGSVNARWLKF